MANETRGGTFWAVVAIAALGWVLAIWAYVASNQAESRFQRQIEQVQSENNALSNRLAERAEVQGALDTLQEERQALQTEVEELVVIRDDLQSQIAPIQDEVSRLQSQAQELAATVEDRQMRVNELEAQLEPLREELAGIEARTQEARQTAEEQTQQLEEIGARLEEARARETELQNEVATLSEEAAMLSNQANEAEARLQEAREVETQVQQNLTSMRNQVEDLTGRQSQLETAVEDLTNRRQSLSTDVENARSQRDDIQTMVVALTEDLAARSERLSQVESELSQSQSAEPQTGSSGGGQDAAQSGSNGQAIVAPGIYQVGNVVATFDADDTFGMSSGDELRSISGDYTVENGTLTLDNVTGNTGSISFPLSCPVSASENGFAVAQDAPDCGIFAGRTFATVQ